MIFRNKTKIIATIGPASNGLPVLRSMLRAGADILRINGAHGNAAEHKRSIAAVRAAAKGLGLTVAVLVDLPGPKFRIGKLKREPMRLKKGEGVTLLCGSDSQKNSSIPIPHNIHLSLKVGNPIFMNDGAVELRVLRIKGREIECSVKAGGEISSHKGINLPGTKLSVPSLTARDKRILRFAIREKVDYVALSFVRSAKDMVALRRMLKRSAPHIGIIAKIEKPEALKDMDAIIAASDAIMVARGDLGIEVPFDRLPGIQRDILARCLRAGKPSITATQMLESMILAEKPTRAEATDVAQAVWEGSDAVMLSAETSVGINPAAAVEAMARIALEAEGCMPHLESMECHGSAEVRQAQVISRAAGFIAESLNARAIVAPTRSGRTPLFISRNRAAVPVIALTEDQRTARRMCLYWGVSPMAMPRASTVDKLLAQAERAAFRSAFIRHGDTIVIASGAHGQKGDITRLVEVRRV
ncbi:MAG: pyruvate kinase [Pseudomonadota bacterium]